MGPSGEEVVELALDPAVKYVLTVQPSPPLPNRSSPIPTSKVLKNTKCGTCDFTATDSYGLQRHKKSVHKNIVGGKKCPR